jgi:hypothetical protein
MRQCLRQSLSHIVMGGVLALTCALSMITPYPADAVDFFKDPKANKEAVLSTLSTIKSVFSALQLLDGLIVGKGPSLESLLLQVEWNIISEIRTVRNDELNNAAVAHLRNYAENIREMSLPYYEWRLIAWFDDTNHTLEGLENVLLNRDLESARQLAPVYNLLIAARGKAMQEAGFSKESMDVMFKKALEVNHRLVGVARLEFWDSACLDIAFGDMNGPQHYCFNDGVGMSTIEASRMWEMASDDWFDAGKITPRLSSRVLYGGYCPCQVWNYTCGSKRIRCLRSFYPELNIVREDIRQQYNQDATVELLRMTIDHLWHLGYQELAPGLYIASIWP